MNYSTDPETGCWNYSGYLNPQGYGVVFVTKNIFRKAHRISWEQRHGVKLDASQHVHHLCRNKACMNPDHLEVLTPMDHGKQHGPEYANLTLEQVAEIRRRAVLSTTNLTKLAEEFGVTRWNVSDIVRGKTWTDFGGAVEMAPRGCAECGISLEGRRRTAKFCSNTCRQRDWQRRHPEKYRAAQEKYNENRRQVAA